MLDEVREYLPSLALERKLDPSSLPLAVATLPVTIVPESAYRGRMAEAGSKNEIGITWSCCSHWRSISGSALPYALRYPAILTVGPMTDEAFAQFCAGHPNLELELFRRRPTDHHAADSYIVWGPEQPNLAWGLMNGLASAPPDPLHPC